MSPTALIRKPALGLAVAVALAVPPPAVVAGEALIAVAANFTHAAERLVHEFEQRHDHRIIMTTGSTGRLFAQISNGAPFDAFLSADRKHPVRLEQDMLILPGSRFTYAVGRLVLLSKHGHRIEETGASMMVDPSVRRIAIANPALAPYGEAALETIEVAGLTSTVEPKLIFAESVGQVYAFVQTANVELGFVALSQVSNRPDARVGAGWTVPEEYHDPIVQDAVLTLRARGNQAAAAFFEFLKGEAARDIIREFGYDLPGDDV